MSTRVIARIIPLVRSVMVPPRSLPTIFLLFIIIPGIKIIQNQFFKFKIHRINRNHIRDSVSLAKPELYLFSDQFGIDRYHLS